MNDLQAVCNDLEENAIERQDIANKWRSNWKSALIVTLKTREARLSTMESVLHEKIAVQIGENGPLSEEWCATVQAAQRIGDTLDKIYNRMLDLGLHPTRPKAVQPSRAGGRPRSSDPISEATLVAPPVRETPNPVTVTEK